MERRIPRHETGTLQPWLLPVLGVQGSVVPSHEKQVKDGRSETIQNLSAYVLHGHVTTEVLENLHRQIYEEALAKAQADGYQQGYDKGFAQGKHAGHQQGYQEGKRQVDQEVAQFKNLVEQLFDPVSNDRVQLEQWLLQTMQAICTALLSHACASDETILPPIVQEAVAALPAGVRDITICLHPDDVLLIERLLPVQVSAWKLVADTGLQRGDCCVKTAESNIDYRWAARVNQALDALAIDECGVQEKH